jgi:hypothetical protein
MHGVSVKFEIHNSHTDLWQYQICRQMGYAMGVNVTVALSLQNMRKVWLLKWQKQK